MKVEYWTDLGTGWPVTAQCLFFQIQLPGLLWNAKITGQLAMIQNALISSLHHLGAQTKNHLKVFFFTAGTISMLMSIFRSNFRVKHSLLGSCRSEELTISLCFRKRSYQLSRIQTRIKYSDKEISGVLLQKYINSQNLARKTKSFVWDRRVEHRLNKNLGPYSWKILVLRVAPSNTILRNVGVSS